jgi:hypothetical protein
MCPAESLSHSFDRFPDQIKNLRADVAPKHRLAILRDEHEMIVQGINRMGSSTDLAHDAASYRKAYITTGDSVISVDTKKEGIGGAISYCRSDLATARGAGGGARA